MDSTFTEICNNAIMDFLMENFQVIHALLGWCRNMVLR